MEEVAEQAEPTTCAIHAGRITGQVCEVCSGPRCHDCVVEGRCATCDVSQITDERRAAAQHWLDARRRDGRIFFTAAAMLALLVHSAELSDQRWAPLILKGPFGAVGGCCSIGAAWAWARMRGRHWAFGLLGWVVAPLGALAVFALAKKCTLCGQQATRSATQCTRCRGPL